MVSGYHGPHASPNTTRPSARPPPCLRGSVERARVQQHILRVNDGAREQRTNVDRFGRLEVTQFQRVAHLRTQ